MALYHAFDDKEDTLWNWKLGPRAPIACVEAGRAQIKERVFLFGGYMSLSDVSDRVYVFDMKHESWDYLGKLPTGAPETHQGITSDGHRYIYLISGQAGGNCSPCSPRCFAFDAKKNHFSEMPPLPEACYMPVVYFYSGRVHCFGGSSRDRQTPSRKHWSIAADGAKATESSWRKDTSFDYERTHTASYVNGDILYLLGGQIGEVPPVVGSSSYECNFDTPLDKVLNETICIDLKTHVNRVLEPMPEKISHAEHAVMRIGPLVVVAGGVYDRLTVARNIFAFDLETMTWRSFGKLPYPIKSPIASCYNGWLYVMVGQSCIGVNDLRAGKVLDTVWKAKISV